MLQRTAPCGTLHPSGPHTQRRRPHAAARCGFQPDDDAVWRLVALPHDVQISYLRACLLTGAASTSDSAAAATPGACPVVPRQLQPYMDALAEAAVVYQNVVQEQGFL
jgi:hypothetical protein